VLLSFLIERLKSVREIRIHDPSESEQILPSIIKDYPDLIVVDYTVPDAVNGECVIKCYES
jgi:4-hydroxy-tetrahydrodipicolinate reductase